MHCIYVVTATTSALYKNVLKCTKIPHCLASTIPVKKSYKRPSEIGLLIGVTFSEIFRSFICCVTCLTQVHKRALTVLSIERVFELKAYRNHWHIQGCDHW